MPSATSPGPGRLDVPGTHNFRPVAPGRLRPGQLYRSDGLHRLTRAGRRALTDLGVGTVIDLRSAFDRRFGGRDRLRGTGADLVAIPVAGTVPGSSHKDTDPAQLDLRSVYRTILTHYRAELGLAVRVIAEAEAPVLVHCTAGKDRTGLVVALTLETLGLDETAILADYEATQANLDGEWTERMLRRARRFRVPITDNLVEIMAHSPAAALAETLAWLRAEHGGASTYLAAAGVTDHHREQLRERLLPDDVLGG